TVPLKKETVRITLRAKPASGDTQAVPPVASMQKSAAAAGAESDATATAPVAGDDNTATAPVAAAKPPGGAAPPAPPAGAKTIPLAKAPAAPGGVKAPAGAKTIPLAKAPAGAKTAPLQPSGGGAVKPLPKATVQLQKTQPMGASTVGMQRGPATGIISTHGIEEDDEPEGIMPYAIIVLLLAIIVLAIELLTKFVGA
ncbi:unnamed protein product, partial [marine sediment metagenome]